MAGIDFNYGKGVTFSKHIAKEVSDFDRVFGVFKELLTHTSGDIEEAFEWLNTLDNEYNIFNENYSLEDFEEDLKKRGYIKEDIDPDAAKSGNGTGKGKNRLTAKLESALRDYALNQIFGKLKKSGLGNHNTKKIGVGDERDGENRAFQFGDDLSRVNMTESLKNAQINNGISDIRLTENDLIVEETKHKAQMSTVLMIDISHSMILYGEDRITPAKKVAMALVELIHRKYPKDSIDIIVFGNEAWPIKVKDLPYLKVGPYHTNTVAGLELAMDILRRKRNTNKQIFMITDGKPSCIQLPSGEFYKNSNGLDDMIVSKCLNKAAQARKLKIPITTFMIAQDPYLRQFVELFTAQNQGKAFLTGLSGLGEMIFEDYEKNRIKRI
ncbi:VWA domain-containing protein [Flavobacteriaceae bacterium]|jgi:Ca-activated chloride channel family protein|nr:VWA domain-containing protein [Flavobacteriaceae bacterium]MDA7724352.1 VWA domain-containing protein [Flavobacteriaceae bacterium]MDA7727950.1 VWA domain-containing protein [Flavobacteriaceae bacterium]MDA7849562.1 VWA domain-containing protein [Flavobacteriaceae bacterium]|tara:strand:- start:22620 stop:23768 length:1149 start_codon:yes stop_codon:yes gene_type:complete